MSYQKILENDKIENAKILLLVKFYKDTKFIKFY